MIKYEDLVQQLKSKAFASVYILMGEEPFYIDRICKYFENNVIEEQDRDFNQVVLYGKDTSLSEVIANAKQYPFGSERRLVILKEAKEIHQLEKNMDQLVAYVKNPTASTILVVCHKYGKIPQAKELDKHAVVFQSDPVKDYQLSGLIQKQVTQFHFQIDPRSADLLAEHIGNDLSRIYNELSKLRVVLPPKAQITPEVIEQHIGISKEYNIFELQEALATRNIQKVYRIMLNFTQNVKEHPVVVTIAQLYKFYDGMLRYMLSSDKSPKTLAVIFGSRSDFYQKKLIGYARNFQLPQLISIISTLREFDARSKGIDSQCSEEELIKELFYKITHY